MMSQTVSLWAHIMSAVDEFQNRSYNPNTEQEVMHVEESRASEERWW